MPAFTKSPAFAATVGAVGVLALAGFSVKVRSASTAPAAHSPVAPASVIAEPAPHLHTPSVLSVGEYNHVEAQVDSKGDVTFYVYGAREKKLFPLSTIGLDLTMEAKATFAGSGESYELTPKPKPYPNDPTGTSSRFVTRFPRRADQKDVALSLTLPIDNETYRVSWPAEVLRPGATGEQSMPVAATSDEARKLFLVPGGAYTAADIAANGNQTATQKYGMVMSAHNPHPRPGDHICPITDTVSSPRFTWIVSGRSYQFCCPPCIEEFVRQAKNRPRTIKPPETYVQPGLPRS